LPALPAISGARMIAAMQADKKARAGQLRFVVASKIGRSETVSDIPEKVIREVLRELPVLVARKS
jgi:3-dehydroquinate synthetase